MVEDRNRTPQPLVDNQPIVNPNGTPTQYFIRWAQERQIAIEDGISAAQAEQLIVDYLAAHALQAGTGISITPTGSIADDPTIALDAELGDLNDVDMSTAPTDGQVLGYDNASGKWKPVDQTGGGGSGTPPTIRGAVAYRFNAGSYNAVFPAGTVAGDVCVVAANSGWTVGTPAGWTSLSNLPGSNTQGATFYKILDAGDIATGYVTVNFSGSYDGAIGMISYDGATVTGVTLINAVRNGGSTGSVTLGMGTLAATDNVFIYGGARGNGAVGFSTGTIGDSKQGGDSSCAVGDYQPTGPGLVSETVTFAADGGGNYVSLVLVAGIPGGGGGGGTPTMVQFATLRNDGNITLAAAPTPGNLMVLVTGGFGGSIDGYVPAGFALVGGFASDNNNGVRCWGRVVQAGDTGNYPMSASDNQSAVLYEFSGALTAASMSGGRLGGPGGAAWAINFLPSPFGKNNVVLGVVENDSTVQWTVDALTGVVADNIDGTGTGNHTCAFVRVDQSTAGPTISGTITSGGYNNPVYGLFAVIGD